MFVKHNLKLETPKLLLVGHDVKSYLEGNKLKLEYACGLKIAINYSIGQWQYPEKDLLYYENKLFTSLIKFPYNIYGKFDHVLSTHYDGKTLAIFFHLNANGTLKTFKLSLNIEIDTAEENTKVFFDELRDAFVIKTNSEYYLMGLYEKELIKKEIIKKEKGYTLLAEAEIKTQHIHPSATLLISDGYDSFDEYKLEHETNDIKTNTSSILEISQKNVEKVYNLFYNFIKTHEFRDEFLKEYLLSLIDPLREKQRKFRNIKSLVSHKYLLFLEDYQNKKVDWMELITEEKKGSTLLHTVILANILIDKKEYEEAWKLLTHYANSIIDYHIYNERNLYAEDIILEIVLFMRAVNRLFMNWKKENVVKIHIPHSLAYLTIKNLGNVKLLDIYNRGDSEFEIHWKLFSLTKPKFKKLNIELSTYLHPKYKIKLNLKWKKHANKSHYITEGKQIIKTY